MEETPSGWQERRASLRQLRVELEALRARVDKLEADRGETPQELEQERHQTIRENEAALKEP